MELKKLTDEQIEQSFHHVVKSERKIIHLVILHVQEIHRRKLYLAPAYGSLSQYLIKVFKYSGAAAQRRIEAARLMTDVPEVAVKLESGELNLSQVCELQRAVKESEKVHQVKVTKDVKAELVQRVLNQNTSQTQQLCARLLDIPVQYHQKIKTQKDKSKRIETTFTEEQYAKFEKVRDLLAHKNFQKKRTQNINDVLETMFDEILFKHSKSEANAEVEMNTESNRNTVSVTERETEAELDSVVEPTDSLTKTDEATTNANAITEATSKSSRVKTAANWKTLTPKRIRIILAQDKCCQYTNYETGQVCGSTFNLHVDHIIPKYVGGTNNPSNLRVLCREHNLFRNRRVVNDRSLNLT